MTTTRLPDFFIVGHPKSGTTALYEMLREHPQIFMPKMKEPRYFASDLPSSFQRHSDVPPLTREDYLALFAPARADQRVGEASTAYIWSHDAAGAIAAANPAARIIAIFREPASFVRSMHLQLLQIRIEREADLRKAIALEAERREGRRLPSIMRRWPQVLLYTERVRYTEQLRRFRELFAPEQVLALVYDDFRADNQAFLRRVLRFLEVDDGVEIAPLEANPTVRVRSARLEDMVNAADQGDGGLARAVKTTARIALPSRRLRKGAYWLVRRRMVFAKPPALDETLMRELRERFRPEVAAFGEYIGRDLLTLWGYESSAS
ncbi:MAG TPA: sulfotransferase [Solirubrobacteraceae bacterium]|nr:sulfotransferase [Solirubrobacteraceae bacterium]